MDPPPQSYSSSLLFHSPTSQISGTYTLTHIKATINKHQFRARAPECEHSSSGCRTLQTVDMYCCHDNSVLYHIADKKFWNFQETLR